MLLGALAACGRIGIDPLARDAELPTSEALPDADSRAGLIAHYSMDGDPPDGARNAAGPDLHAVCGTQCPARGPGQIGLAATFGTDAYYVVPDSSRLALPAFTVALWVRRAAGGGVTPVVKPQAAGTGASFELVTFGTRTTFCTDPDPGAGGEQCLRGPPLPVGTWTFVAMSFDGGTKRLVIDGIEVARETGVTVYDASPLMIGADRQDGVLGTSFSGSVDELRIYDRVLDDAALSAVFALR